MNWNALPRDMRRFDLTRDLWQIAAETRFSRGERGKGEGNTAFPAPLPFKGNPPCTQSNSCARLCLSGRHMFRTPTYERLDVSRTMAVSQLQINWAMIRSGCRSPDVGTRKRSMDGWTTLAALAGSPTCQIGRDHQGITFTTLLTAKKTATRPKSAAGALSILSMAAGKAEHHAYGLYYPEAMETRVAEVVETWR